MTERKLKRCRTCGEHKDARRDYYKNSYQDCIDCREAIDALKHRKAAEKRVVEREEEKAAEDEKQYTRQRIQTLKRSARRNAQRTARENAKERARKIREREALLKRERKDMNAAQRELAARELSRRRLLALVKRMFPDYQAGWVHRDICARLEKFSDDVAAGKSPRLMIQMPPRHGKSELASKYFPAWHLGRHPRHEIITASYSGSLASDFSKAVREILRDPDYQSVFDTRLHPDNQNVEGWKTTRGGGYVPAGVGGAITGRGAHVLIIDDPIKNAEEADSEISRENIWAWFTSTAYTRLAPGGGVLVIQTRWHHDDLSGRLEALMAEGEGETWDIIRYPAEATENEEHRAKDEPLHPDRFDSEALARIKKTVGPRVWGALYQQNPTPDEGGYFREDMIRRYDDAPPIHTLRIYQAWDLAIGKKETNDWTVGITVGVDREDRLWVLERVRGRWDSFEIVEEILDAYQRWGADVVGIEKGQIQMAIGPYLERRIRERQLYRIYIRDLPTGRRDKVARARSVQGRMRQGMVLFPRNAYWFDELVNELLHFPNGKHDDQVDALAWIGIMLDEMIPLPDRPREKRTSWRDKLRLGRRGGGGHHMAA